ncbi:MAG: Gfo/Idh/MocA family oxidoreductase [Acidimicrobiia bacterium]|nr:Gfo/Idh/MocA family oxidoreductase [Acidimicrobiia bacterium]MDH4307274.1 Gfo/Idh/MocA family oxidoreductase [Acidimicrobiia bacterium]
MARPLRVGLVGADATGRGWGPVAHIPALRGIEGVELVALCTSRPESASAAAAAYGVDRAYHDVGEMAAEPDIDIVSVVVRVPHHHQVVMAALEAGKHVFCEWPLGSNLAEAQQMAALAREKGVVTAIGLQGRHDPRLTHVKELHDEGWLGEIVSVNVSLLAGGAGTSDSRSAWMGRADNGANFVTIAAGHTIDYVTYCLGPVAEVSASVATQVPQWQLADSGETIDVDAPDTVLLNGTLAGGGLLSLHAASVPFNGSNWRMEIYGTEGTIVASTPVLPQISPITLEGARGDGPLSQLPTPERLVVVPEDVPHGPARNVAAGYVRMAAAIKDERRFDPDFDHARELHELLEALQHSSDTGSAVTLHDPNRVHRLPHVHTNPPGQPGNHA